MTLPRTQAFDSRKPPAGVSVDGQRSMVLDTRMRQFNVRAFFEESDAEGPSGYFGTGDSKRRIITRDVKINGGVYLGSSAREAVVVDDGKDQTLRDVYIYDVQINKTGLKEDKKFNSASMIRAIYNIVRSKIPYSLEVSNRLEKLAGPDGKITLGSYIHEGGGVCRHQALLAGYLIEKLISEGIIKGSVSVDRNVIEGKGGHAWARYTNESGEVYIIDAAQQYCGLLEDVPEEKWFYDRLPPPEAPQAQQPQSGGKKTFLDWLRARLKT